jgi:hypothetical protein
MRKRVTAGEGGQILSVNSTLVNSLLESNLKLITSFVVNFKQQKKVFMNSISKLTRSRPQAGRLRNEFAEFMIPWSWLQSWF